MYLLASGNPESLADKPRLISATPLSQTAVQLRFDQKLDLASAQKVSNYQIAPGIQIKPPPWMREEALSISTRHHWKLIKNMP